MVIRLSQGQFNLLEICPRKFQHTYLDQLGSLTSLEQQERFEWGNRFHLLMQQHELGLPITAFKVAEEPLQRSAEALIAAAPDVFDNPTALFRQSEYRQTIELEGYLLTVVYDLLILQPQHAQILDWKTYPRPTQRRSLERNWQTRLYPFVLAETSGYSPEAISMTYWFVQGSAAENAPAQPQSLTFHYSTRQYQRDRQDITDLLTQLTQWRSTQQPLPQVEESKGYCAECPFAIRCQRTRQSLNHGLTLTLDEIQEVAL